MTDAHDVCEVFSRIGGRPRTEDIFAPLRRLGVGASPDEFGAAITQEQIAVLQGCNARECETYLKHTAGETIGCKLRSSVITFGSLEIGRCGICTCKGYCRQPIHESREGRIPRWQWA